jgi:hypothetical protein
MKNLIGHRKFFLGVLTILVVAVWVETAILKGLGAGIISAVSGAITALAACIGVIVYGNVKENQSKNGGNL